MLYGAGFPNYLSPQRKGQPRLKRKMKPKRTVIGLVERGGKATRKPTLWKRSKSKA